MGKNIPEEEVRMRSCNPKICRSLKGSGDLIRGEEWRRAALVSTNYRARTGEAVATPD